ncbi:hypothetical protein N7499_001489 [Penicillium canescens]|uniref:Zn(2)-C6 fungal-type domain-containing protein n=1 Tax=Penicillium canescens TaxID=5083 RepID=A0AAD6I5H5_PENCN|nr:uncharacterized protein N7446_009028 [Penicillium canescens]KAJ6034280.1 hypothetical protein N7460_008455 [Penicillium canescens]KAJ6045943.1 hypothetical protein N7444_007197 [Penicillium canescens]KAJ6053016.1 hypothetical protein N7446_009028 [Penicillium canescens]KAJ6097115.1 hypothetical protein N7499_001489 [Penicillium canescens]KAJ6165104.1 hypothetical protein N7485_008348 [Penicillium canescens]
MVSTPTFGAASRWSLPEVTSPQRVRDGERQASSRVCDNCIRKKIKCDLKRPSCSRCLERGYTCTYSSTRRKPGPARGALQGSHRGLLPSRSSRRSFVATSTEACSLEAIDTLQDRRTSTEPFRQTDFQVKEGEEEHLLIKYLDMIHDAIPIFSRQRFLPGVRSSLYSRDLISTLVLITAKLTGFTFSSDDIDIDACIDLMLSSGSLQEDMFGDVPSLDQFRKACLLAFYEFHQFPGRQAWMRISKLIRMAYWIGLDHLENLRPSLPYWCEMSQHELEDWRLVWWCVYRLDSYANLSVGTPYLIDETLVNTALIRDQPSDSLEESQPGRQGQLYLPSQPDRLWELLSAIASDSPQTSLFNIHIITTTATRQVGRVARLNMPGRQGETNAYLADLERRLSALRLALSINYLNPMRNAFTNESGSEHHARLVNLFHLSMARLLISLMRCAGREEGNEWLLSWQQVLETCRDITSLSEQWNGAFTLSVDPAISFILFTALIFLNLHKRFAAVAASAICTHIEHCENVLLLQLEQFATAWTLPRLLIREFMTILLLWRPKK